jgi:tellurite resistance protein TehA-like permease
MGGRNQVAQSPHDRARLPGQGRVGGYRLLGAWLGREISALDPGCFALVMATGIVSNGFFLEGQREISDALFAVNLAAYLWLGSLTLLRALRFGKALWEDLVNPRLVFSFFTFVAATDVLGMSTGIRGFSTIALSMWGLAFVVWAILIYLGFAVLAVFNADDGAKIIDGAWLNAIVGTQSLVILGGEVALPAANVGAQGYLVIHMLWTIGLGLYGIYVALLSYRAFFFALKPTDVTPVLWVVMGAAAISANAGSVLALDGAVTPFLRTMQPFVDGVTFAIWAWATWCIPPLTLLGIWKHGIHRAPIGRVSMLWSMVFPLGMYAVTSFRLSRVADAPTLATWSSVVAWIALAAWGATALAVVVASVRSARTFIELAPTGRQR